MFCPQCGQSNVAGGRFCVQCGIALAAPAAPRGERRPSDAEVSAFLEDHRRTYGTANLIGLLVTLLAALGLWQSITNPGGSGVRWPNVVSMLLLGAFGLAVVGRKRAAIPLGWTYFSLLILMTVAHGFIPLELAQVLALLWFMFYLRGRLAASPKR